MATQVLNPDTEGPFPENEYDKLLLLLQFGKNASSSSNRKERKSEIFSSGLSSARTECQPKFENLCIKSKIVDDTYLNLEVEDNDYEAEANPSRLHVVDLVHTQNGGQTENLAEVDSRPEAETGIVSDFESSQNLHVELLREFFEGALNLSN